MLSLPTDTESVSDAKSAFRRLAREKRKSLDPDQRKRMDTALRANILKNECVLSADTVLLFCPVKGEPDILPITDTLVFLGKKVAFPVSHTDTLTLEFRYVSSENELVAGAYGIPEPPAGAVTVTELENTVCLVPALAFDMQGMRIGYGKGYYDRFLRSTGVTAVGISYADLVADKLPHEDTDIPVDMIITEGGVILPDAKAK
ncbi:MAG: 5-formyltetrahydrofolate cyclo-ligase [Clostridia bacterium]|nr:5-formyltetrahydrofolate cyclo-ligase [Clostridia bacterium]